MSGAKKADKAFSYDETSGRVAASSAAGWPVVDNNNLVTDDSATTERQTGGLQETEHGWAKAKLDNENKANTASAEQANKAPKPEKPLTTKQLLDAVVA